MDGTLTRIHRPGILAPWLDKQTRARASMPIVRRTVPISRRRAEFFGSGITAA
jgi:hypothetical protein